MERSSLGYILVQCFSKIQLHYSIKQEEQKFFGSMDHSSVSNIQWGSFEAAIPIHPDVGLEIEITSSSLVDQAHEASKEQIEANDCTSRNSLTIPHRDSIEQEIGTTTSILVDNSSVLNIQWGSIESSIPITLNEIEIASISLIDQSHKAPNNHIEVNDITFPSKLSM